MSSDSDASRAAIARAAAASGRPLVGWIVDQVRDAFPSEVTLLAVCPNSKAVLEAAAAVSADADAPILLAATLNQVDVDGGYTGWTPGSFVAEVNRLAAASAGRALLFPCLDHGGPWQKDAHANPPLPEPTAMAEVCRSIEACIDAGYELLHIDPTLDPHAGGRPVLDRVVDRTVKLIAHAEKYREEKSRRPVAYEVGTEEVHAELADEDRLEAYLAMLEEALRAARLEKVWPSFVVARVGTMLHTVDFDEVSAARLTQVARKHASLLKGHYSDFVATPEAYPRSGMGGANVGPELTSVEYAALEELTRLERDRGKNSALMQALQDVLEESGRWQKWLTDDERGATLRQLPEERRMWLISTGCRYVWAHPEVAERRTALYQNVRPWVDGQGYVVEKLAAAMTRYISAFKLRGFGSKLVHRASRGVERSAG